MQLTIEQGTTIVDTRVFAFAKPVIAVETPSVLYYHLIFRAGDNLDLIDKNRRKDFYAFIFGCAHALDGAIEAIGGKGGSIQLLVSLNPTETPADFIKKVKLFTASWAKRKLNLPDFAWRDVEVSTVSQSQRRRISSSIQSRNFLF
jgi:hypothetical protein